MSGPQVKPQVPTVTTVEEWRSFWIASVSIHELQFQELLTEISKGDLRGYVFLCKFVEKRGGPQILNAEEYKAALKGLMLAKKVVGIRPKVSAILQASSPNDHDIDCNRKALVQNILVDVDGAAKRAYFYCQ